MTRNNIKFLSYFLLFSILFFNCKTDYDIKEIAPPEFLSSEHDHTNEEVSPDFAPPLTESENTDITEQVEDSHAGHNHAAGARNHGTNIFVSK